MKTPEATGHHHTPSEPAAVSPTGALITEHQLAARWQVHPGSLANARHRGRNVVPFIKVMGRVRYSVTLVEAYEATLLAEAAA